jgi:hypothetical protein
MKNIKKEQLIGISPNSNLFKQYKASLISLSSIQFEASIGLILGDASLNTENNGKTYRLKFEWSDKHKAYIDHVYNIFNEWLISPPHKKERISLNGNLVINWGFQTISHEAFNPLAEIFLINNKKSIKDSLIKEHLTGRGLAHWFSDDGGKLDYNKNSKNKSIVLNTQSFTDLEVISLAKGLNEKFNLNTEIRSNKNKKIIIIKSDSYLLFRDLIDPFLIPEMAKKLP